MTKALPLVAYTDLASQVEALERDGYVYYPSTINADEVAKLKATMDQREAIDENFDRHDEPQNSGGFLNKIIITRLTAIRFLCNISTNHR